MNNWKQHLVPDSFTIREAMVRLNELAIVNADIFVVDGSGELLGSLSDGDIRRALIKGAEMQDAATVAMNPACIAHTGAWPSKEAVQICKGKAIRFLPLLSPERKIMQVIDIDMVLGAVPVHAVLMAGGEGQRLRPLTEKLPKPLLPIGNKPIIEHNIDRLLKYGIQDIHISINYLGHMLQDYFGNGATKTARINYIREDKPLGTVGAVAQVRQWSADHILVMNSDLLTDIDYADFFDAYISGDADMAIAAVPYKVNVPYAVLETNGDHEVKSLAEKPTYTYYSNAGIYLIKRELLQFIPEDCCYNMTDLIDTLIEKGYKVVSYPIHSYWLDIGKMHDYLKAQEDIQYLKL